LQLAGAVLAVALGLGGCAVMEPKAEGYVAPPLGSTWIFARRNSGSFGSTSAQLLGIRGERVWQGQQVITFETQEGATLAHPREGSWLGYVNRDTPVMTWDPPIGYEWPLVVGKTWTKNHRVTIHATNQVIPYQMTMKVEAYEDVATRAGTFKAFRISSSTTLGDENVNWFSPELGIFVKTINTRTAKNAAGVRRSELELVSQTIKK
jgi:hypothetical protein